MTNISMLHAQFMIFARRFARGLEDKLNQVSGRAVARRLNQFVKEGQP